MITDELENKSKEELLQEVYRCRKVAENIWHSITRVYGVDGFTRVLNYLERFNVTDAAPKVLLLEAENENLKLIIDQLKDQLDATYDNLDKD
jgi:predicted HAD superfamily Cof-like phosphohydrolase